MEPVSTADNTYWRSGSGEEVSSKNIGFRKGFLDRIQVCLKTSGNDTNESLNVQRRG